MIGKSDNIKYKAYFMLNNNNEIYILCNITLRLLIHLAIYFLHHLSYTDAEEPGDISHGTWDTRQGTPWKVGQPLQGTITDPSILLYFIYVILFCFVFALIFF